MIIGFVIWSVVAAVFAGIGITCRKSREAVGFFTFAKAPAVKDPAQYNKAASALWFVSAALLELLGVPLLFLEQNSPFFLVVTIGAMALVIGMIVAYFQIEAKHRI